MASERDALTESDVIDRLDLVFWSLDMGTFSPADVDALFEWHEHPFRTTPHFFPNALALVGVRYVDGQYQEANDGK